MNRQGAHDISTSIWWQRAGVAGLTFFFVKGLLWLVMPIMLYMLG